LPFTTDILNYKSLSIAGLEKNTGKTECLNYVLSRLRHAGKKIAVTSVGVDGESTDIVKHTRKPEVELFEDVVFITSEHHYRQKRLTSVILDLSSRHTALGRLVTARSLSSGKVVFSGPSDTHWLRECIAQMDQYGVDTTIVDGAVSRLSLASPAVTDCMILTTGAAVSANLRHLVKKTKFAYDLIQLPVLRHETASRLRQLENGIWSVDETGQIHPVQMPSVFLIDQYKDEIFRHGNILYVSGAVNEKLLHFLQSQQHVEDITLVARDFTRFFVSPETLRAYLRRGGRIAVLYRTQLIAVCVNPVSPDGYTLDSQTLQTALSEELGIPVYDIKQIPA
jgi:molybdopterin-guanine dinucleotide biosynthesis protein